MADWLGISSSEYDSHCGDDGSHTIEEALDGTDYWAHIAEVHWFILDLGESYTITKVRGRSNALGDPIDVDIYVSDSKEDWGDAVKEGIATWQDTSVWVEIDTTQKSGRYIKVVVNATEYGTPGAISWGKTFGYFSIFDAYGEVGGGITAEYTAQTLRSITSLADYVGQAKRVIKKLASYIAQTKRILTALILYAQQIGQKIKLWWEWWGGS